MKEIQLAQEVIYFLKDMKWEIYQEVKVPGGVIDIVGIRNNISWIIETKCFLSLQLLEQVYKKKQMSNYISIATPRLRNVKGRFAAEMFLRNNGIGYLQTEFMIGTTEIITPKLFRIKRNLMWNVTKYLVEQQKDYANAGNPDCRYWTPFKGTCKNITEYVCKNPGCTIKELIDNINHHYHSSITAKSSINAWINQGVIKNILREKHGKSYKLYIQRINNGINR